MNDSEKYYLPNTNAELARLRAQVNELQERLSSMVKERRADCLRNQVRQFQVEVMGFVPPVIPAVPEDPTISRTRLLRVAEEFFELAETIVPVNRALRAAVMTELKANQVRVHLDKMAHESADLDYSVEGLRQAHGVPRHPVAGAIHAANMSKKGCAISSEFKLLKPPDFKGADVRSILLESGWRP